MTRPSYWLDPSDARLAGCSSDVVEVVLRRNSGDGWRKIARDLGIPMSTLRSRWAVANRKLRGDAKPAPARDVRLVDHQLLRGIPVAGHGGAIRDTTPGSQAWKAQEAATGLPRVKRGGTVTPTERQAL